MVTPVYAQTILDDVLAIERDKFFLSLITLVGAEAVTDHTEATIIFAPADDYFRSLGSDQQLALFGPTSSDAAREFLRNHLFVEDVALEDLALEDVALTEETPEFGRLLRLIAAPERTLRLDSDAGQAGGALVLGEPVVRDQLTWVSIDRPLAASDFEQSAEGVRQETPQELQELQELQERPEDTPQETPLPLAPEAELEVAEVVEVVTATNRNLLQLLEREPDLSRFTALLRETGMDAGVETYPRYTLFAPTNAAFDGFDRAGQSRKALINLLARHIVQGKLQRDDLLQAEQVLALNGSVLVVEASGAGIRKPVVQSVPLSPRTLVARNGVIHPIEQLLLGE